METTQYSYTSLTSDMAAAVHNITDKEPDNNVMRAGIYVLLGALGLTLNIIVLSYILVKRIWRNYVSSHFIAHLMFTNILAFTLLCSVFVHNLYSEVNLWANRDSSGNITMTEHGTEKVNVYCRMQAFATCAIWTVMHFMTTCIAGVHLLTFARIHYDQLFGLRPSLICGVSWVIGCALGLPCITNIDIVEYDDKYHYCVWGMTLSGYKFLTYLILLGVILPSILTWVAYVRVLGILFHSPIVFESLGLYKSRWLVYCFMLTPFYHVPFFIMRMWPDDQDKLPISLYDAAFFMTFSSCILSPVLFGLSIFIMKEEDLAIRPGGGHNKTAYHPAGNVPQQL